MDFTMPVSRSPAPSVETTHPSLTNIHEEMMSVIFRLVIPHPRLVGFIKV